MSTPPIFNYTIEYYTMNKIEKQAHPKGSQWSPGYVNKLQIQSILL